MTDLPENDPNRLTIKDEDQTVTGMYRPPGGGEPRSSSIPAAYRRRRAAQ